MTTPNAPQAPQQAPSPIAAQATQLVAPAMTQAQQQVAFAAAAQQAAIQAQRVGGPVAPAPSYAPVAAVAYPGFGVAAATPLTGYFVVFGPVGAGKSTAVMETFCRDSVLLQSALNNIHTFKMNGESGRYVGKPYCMPKRILTLESCALMDSLSPTGFLVLVAGPDGRPAPLPQKAYFTALIRDIIGLSVVEKAQGRPLTFRNLIIDEAGAFFKRAFIEITAASVTKKQEIDTRAAYVALEAWAVEICNQFRMAVMAGMNVVIVAHDRDPDPATEKQGGPQFQSQATMKQMCADADGVLMRDLLDPVAKIDLNMDAAAMMAAADAAKRAPAERPWIAYASQHWQSKLRGLPEDMYYQIRNMHLYDILRLAGFAP